MGIYDELSQLDNPSPTPKVSRTHQRHRENPESQPPTSGDTMTPRHRDTTTPRHRDITPGSIIEVVRKAVKEFGKEAATHRFTVEEKKAIAGIIYSYKVQGIRTSENEVARIAVNYLVRDYEENGENSVLNKILQALNG